MLERGARVETRSIPMVACLNPPPRLQFTGSLLVERLRTPRTGNIKDNAPGRWKNEHRGAHCRHMAPTSGRLCQGDDHGFMTRQKDAARRAEASDAGVAGRHSPRRE